MIDLVTTYSLLGFLKETSESNAAITELYIPLVKKALYEYGRDNEILEYKGRSLSEISSKIKDIFDIDIPLPIVAKIMEAISKEINDEKVFTLYKDGSFIIKSFVFEDIDGLIVKEIENILTLEKDFLGFCEENGEIVSFEDLKSFILSQKIDLFSDQRSDYLDVNYVVPKYINDRMGNPTIFQIISNIYLGSIIVSYLERDITNKVTDAELLLDTNFFISLIDLNTEDAHHTCNQLFDLCKQMGYRFTMLSSTVDQIRVLLSNRIYDFNNMSFIGSVKTADIFNACIRRNLDKTQLERIKDNILKYIQDRGIVIIQDAQIKEIIERAKKSSEFKELLAKRQNEESALNDAVAKLYVEKKRGKYIKEFVDVKCWFLHNSNSPYDYNYGRRIHERYMISANELLVLLWLSSPAQGRNIKINDVTRGSLASYITKYRRSKIPTQDTLKVIKKRIDDAVNTGLVSERDTFNLCIRMAEGQLTQEEVDETLLSDKITEEQFAENLKVYANEIEEKQKRQKLDYENELESMRTQAKALEEDHQRQEEDFKKEIQGLNNELGNRDKKIKGLEDRIAEIEKNNYQSRRESFIEFNIKKLKKDTRANFLIVILICAIWCADHFFLHVLPEEWMRIVLAVLSMIATTFGISFFRKGTSVKDYFCRNKLRQKFGSAFDEQELKK